LLSNLTAYVNKYVKYNAALITDTSQIVLVDVQPPRKKLKILSYLPTSTDRIIHKSLECMYHEYLHVTDNTSNLEETTISDFWRKNESNWPELASFAKFLLTIPATSAPVKRIFSIGGAIHKLYC
jgi:hypothetical protein